MTNTTNDLTALREMAQAALKASEGVTDGPWFGVTSLEVHSAHDDVICESTGGIYDQELINMEFIGKSRQLVPDLATALLAALDRVEELTARYEGSFVPVEDAKEGDVLGYSQVVYAGRGKPLRQKRGME